MRRLAVALLAVWLAGCGPPGSQEPAARPEPVVVYAAYADKTYLPALLNDFTEQTGIAVIVRNGTVPAIVDDVITGRVAPPADVLLTPAVYGVWRTAEEGELRPNYSAAVADTVPAWLRDPDNYWVALSYRHAVLVYDPDRLAAEDLGSYATLASPAFRGKLCLASSGLPINRAVIAMLMQRLGDREAELAVRGWVANLAEPVFDDERQLLQAIETKACAIGVVSSDVVALAGAGSLRVYEPEAVATQLEGLGVTRHASNPEGGFALVEWLLGSAVQRRHAAATGAVAVTAGAKGDMPVVRAAMRHEDAGRLAERARYR